jgi:hypothetical protein
MRWRIPLLIVLLAFVAVSCDQQPTSPVNDQAVVENPTFNWMNDHGGSLRVYRFADDYAACWTGRTGLRACHATVPLGGGAEPDCGLQVVAEPGAWQDVLIKEDAWEDLDRMATHFTGGVYITVRDLNSPGDCFDAELVAEGWGSVVALDNAIFGATEPNTNTWGASAHVGS